MLEDIRFSAAKLRAAEIERFFPDIETDIRPLGPYLAVVRVYPPERKQVARAELIDHEGWVSNPNDPCRRLMIELNDGAWPLPNGMQIAGAYGDDWEDWPEEDDDE